MIKQGSLWSTTRRWAPKWTSEEFCKRQHEKVFPIFWWGTDYGTQWWFIQEQSSTNKFKRNIWEPTTTTRVCAFILKAAASNFRYISLFSVSLDSFVLNRLQLEAEVHAPVRRPHLHGDDEGWRLQAVRASTTLSPCSGGWGVGGCWVWLHTAGRLRETFSQTLHVMTSGSSSAAPPLTLCWPQSGWGQVGLNAAPETKLLLFRAINQNVLKELRASALTNKHAATKHSPLTLKCL